MTDLTDKWKKGEIPSGWYWVELKEGAFVDGKKSIILDYLFEFTNDFERHPYLVESVLAPVPSYEKYISLVNWKEDLTELCTVKERIIEKYENIDTWWKANYTELKEENAQLKDVLKTIKRQCELLLPKNGLAPVGDRQRLCKTFFDLIDGALK